MREGREGEANGLLMFFTNGRVLYGEFDGC